MAEEYGSGKPRSSLEKKISILLIYWAVIMPILTGQPFVPQVLKYVADVLWLSMVLCVLIKRRIVIRKDIRQLVLLVAVLFVYAMTTALLHFDSIFYFVWGFRNLFRFYIAFFAYADMISGKTVEKWFSFLDIVFLINAVLSVIQFTFLGVRQDFLGGVFGITGHTNGYTIPLLTVVIVRHVCLSFEGKEKMGKGILFCVIALLVAAMAELKFFFVLFLLILVAAAMLTRFSAKKLVLLIVGGVATFIGAEILVYWFGFDNFFSLEGIIEQATRESYSNATAGDVNRLSAIPTLNQMILDSPLQRIFGLGLGNCDTSGVAIFNTQFYVTYSHLHYTWFTAPMVYLEMGYFGLTIYMLFFVICFWLSYKAFVRRKGNRLYCQMAIIMAMVCCALAFYNSSLRYEAAYMIYFILALPFIRQTSEDAAGEAEQ